LLVLTLVLLLVTHVLLPTRVHDKTNC